MDQLINARKILDRAEVPNPSHALMNEYVTRGLCAWAGVKYQPSQDGTIAVGGFTIHILELVLEH